MKNKTLIRLLALVLTLLMVVPCFACDQATDNDTTITTDNNDNESTDDTTTGGEGNIEIPKEYLMIAENKETAYSLIYSANANIALGTACTGFKTDFKKISGVDFIPADADNASPEYEIIVGENGRSDLAELAATYQLKDNDFAIKVVEKKIVVLGSDDWALAAGVEFLMARVLCTNSQTRSVAINPEFEYVARSAASKTDVRLDSKDDHYVCFTVAPGSGYDVFCRLSYTGNKGWRIQTKFKFDAEFNDIGASQRLSLSLAEDPVLNVEKITVNQTAAVLEAVADDTRAVIHLDEFYIDFFTENGALANTITELSNTLTDSSISTALETVEAIYGSGENYYSANQRGKTLNLFTTDIWDKVNAIYMAIPLFSSSRGSGIFINRYEEINCDIGYTQNDTFKNTVVGSVMDCYIFATEQIADVIYGYSALSGFADMPEEWTYGMIVCRYSPDLSQKHSGVTSAGVAYEGVYEAIENMEKFDLPWTGILAEAWGPYSTSKHQDLKELCDYVHSLGKKFLVYMAVGDCNSVSGFMDKYAISISPNGNETIMLPQTNSQTNNPDVGTSAGNGRDYLDITDPAAVEWFFDTYWDYLSNEIGVDGCKIDFCEQIPENYEINFYDETMPTPGTHHWYPTAFCAMFWEMIDSKPDSGMCFTRGGGIGSQRSPFMWAGDQSRRYDRLEWQLTNLLSSGLSGVPFMSHDMSGYQYNGASQDIVYEGGVFVRGTQWTAFTANMQTHGKVRKSYDFALAGDGRYAYFTNIYRAYTKLHEALTPYITEYSEIACETGMPLARHLVLHYQNDPRVFNIDDEYMFGDAFLVAPELDSNNKRNIYLPEGTWIDMNTGKEYVVGANGMTITDYAVPLATLPVFFNKNHTSETADDIYDAIVEALAYARSCQPK